MRDYHTLPKTLTDSSQGSCNPGPSLRGKGSHEWEGFCQKLYYPTDFALKPEPYLLWENKLYPLLRIGIQILLLLAAANLGVH